MYKHKIGKAKNTLPPPKEEERKAKRNKLEEIATKKPSTGLQIECLGLRETTYSTIIRHCKGLIARHNMPNRFRCILITGPRGVGKTTLINSIAVHTKLPLIGCDRYVDNNTKQYIRLLFQSAIKQQPCLLYFDNVDKAFSQANLTSGVADEIENNICDMMGKNHKIFILLASSEAQVVDKHLGENLLEKIELQSPYYEGRIQVIKNLIDEMKKHNNLLSQLNDNDIQYIARRTNLYCARDLALLIQTAIGFYDSRVEQSTDTVNMGDFDEALRQVVPFLKQEGFEQIPDITWDDVGGLDSVRELIRSSIINTIREPDGSDIDYGAGILLHGPPGCGKTLVAKAVANEVGLNFIAVDSTDLMNKFLGETEANIRRLFARARQCHPCMIFLDEIDAISGSRPDRESNHPGVNCVQALLTAMDGFKNRGCFVMAATNRLDSIDPAIKRSGRFSDQIFIGYPSEGDRERILRAIMRKHPISTKIDVSILAKETCHFSGADLKQLVRKARGFAYVEDRPVEMKDFERSKHTIMEQNKEIGYRKKSTVNSRKNKTTTAE